MGKAHDDDRPDVFTRFTTATARVLGHAWVFSAAVAVLVVWACTGPLLKFSDTWQLVINTSTTIITFLMVFLIQNTQNRDTAALHLKLNEIIRAKKGAHLSLLDIEKLDEDEFQAFRRMYDKLAEQGRAKLDAGESDQDCPDTTMKPLQEELSNVA